jgi:predicted transcriptional regulator
MNKDAFNTALARFIKESGSQTVAARRLHVSDAYLSDVKNGRREPGAKILTALGLRRIVNYERTV